MLGMFRFKSFVKTMVQVTVDTTLHKGVQE